MKSALTGFYWIASLAAIAGAGYLLFSRPDLLTPKGAKPPVAAEVKTDATMPPQPVAPAANAVPLPERGARIIYEAGRTQQPLQELTSFYQRREMLAGAPPRKHTLTYYLYAPAKPYPEGLKFPLVLVLHDVHGVANAGEVLIEGDMPVKHPAFVVVPVLPYGKKWAMPQDFPEMTGFEPLIAAREGLPDAVQLVDTLKLNYPIDDKRVYVVGCADGGFGAFGAALRYPDVFAAAVPISSGWTAEDAKGFGKVPLWIFHGAQDNSTSAELSRTAASYINAYGGKANYTEVPNVGHDCDSGQFYRPVLWDWLFSQHK